MSLMQLLTAGRSLSTIKDQPHRFRMRRENLLPTFGPAKDLEAGLPPAGPVPKAGMEANGRPAAQISLPHSPPPQPVVRESQPERPVSPPTGRSARPAPPVRRSRFKNPFTRKAGVPVVAPAVQAELSLAAVQVVRNDLTETELPTRPARRTPSPAAQRAAAADERKATGVVEFCRRMISRWFGASKS